MRIHFIINNDNSLQDLVLELSKTDIVTSKIEDITSDIAFVIVEKNTAENDAQWLKAKNLGLKMGSYAEFIYEYFKNKTRVVITSSKNKASTVAMVLHTMDFCGVPVSFWLENPINGKRFQYLKNAEFVIIESDETILDFDARPKFHNYHPTVALLNEISEKENAEKYAIFIDSITKGGILIYNKENNLLREIVENSENSVRKIEYETPDYHINENKLLLSTDEGELPLENVTQEEIINVEGAKWVCQNMGVDAADFYEAMVSFGY